MKKQLRWKGGWQKEFAEVGKELGYEVKWCGGYLSFRKNGELIGYVKPKEREFFMEDLIADAEKQYAEEAKKPKRKLTKEDFNALVYTMGALSLPNGPRIPRKNGL